MLFTLPTILNSGYEIMKVVRDHLTPERWNKVIEGYSAPEILLLRPLPGVSRHHWLFGECSREGKLFDTSAIPSW